MNSGITGVILAGGQSKRMGANKAFVRLNGKPLISYALNALEKITPNILLSAGSESIHYKNLPVVEDIYPGCGPAGGIFSALSFSETNLNLVLSCDMPFVSSGLLKFLVDEAVGNPADVILPVDEKGQWQTLCAVYSKSIMPQLEKAVIQKKLMLKKIISKTNYRLISIEKFRQLYLPNTFYNINTPNELCESEKLWLQI